MDDEAASSAPIPSHVDDDDDTVKSTDGEEDEAVESNPTSAASDSLRQVSTAEAQAYATESSLLFYEASAKTGAGVGDLFTHIGTSILVATDLQPKPSPLTLSIPSPRLLVVEAEMPLLQRNLKTSISVTVNRPRRRVDAVRSFPFFTLVCTTMYSVHDTSHLK